eukprot:m.200746 g.200746  ORF g.200746 m.200746 type:complete len:537 (+) comp18409_c0_seq7:390-2000(+)
MSVHVSPVPSPAGHVKPPAHRPFVRCRSVTLYEKIDKIGQGTFGEVFKGRNKRTKELVALKKVLMKVEQEGFPLTALREIQILKALRHPNVLCVKEIVHSAASDFNRQRGSIYIVMEYLDHDLGGLLNQGVEFTAPEVKCLAKQLLTGLWFIHQAGFIHRDMKVANLLLSKDGVLKIADFGLARKIFKKDQKDAKYTSVVCTRWYRPPELLLGERRYSTAIDMWGVGCIVAELFTGRPILQGGVADAKDESENDLDQLMEIYKLCGTPTLESWPGHKELPGGKFVEPKQKWPRSVERRFQKAFRIDCPSGIDFVDFLLVMDPKQRPDANKALDHSFFWSEPMPCEPNRIQKFQHECHEWKVPPRASRISQVKRKGPAHMQAQAAPATSVGGGVVGAGAAGGGGSTTHHQQHRQPHRPYHRGHGGGGRGGHGHTGHGHGHQRGGQRNPSHANRSRGGSSHVVPKFPSQRPADVQARLGADGERLGGAGRPAPSRAVGHGSSSPPGSKRKTPHPHNGDAHPHPSADGGAPKRAKPSSQ